eukprot:GHVS01097328.1.p2 GENE.GHVS01097328.1~~GHVS01097328.1.p2  ORF type:complete len:159 (+),score=13.25 GHVS01097328.1:328-804(+)
MTYLAEHYPQMYRDLLIRSRACLSESPTPFVLALPLSAALVNLTRMLVIYLRVGSNISGSVNPALSDTSASKRCRKTFARLLLRSEQSAFEELFCACAAKLVDEWRRTSDGGAGNFAAALEGVKLRVIAVLNDHPMDVSEFLAICKDKKTLDQRQHLP